MSLIHFSIIAVAILILIAVIIAVCYVKAPPSSAFIISGISKEPRVLIGKGGFKVPFFERLDKVYLGQITVDIKTESSVPTNDFINVDVDAVSKIRIEPTTEGIRLAAKNFLNMSPSQIAGQLQDSLQGNMREIIGTLDLKKLNTDRDGFSDEVMKKASPDMAKLGIEIISCNIQNITDKEGLIRDLGADNTAKIKKDAAITKANADRDVAISTAIAQKEANDARVNSETAISEKNNELLIRQAELKELSDSKQAIADAAYEIQKQEQQKTINAKVVEAQIEQVKREQILSEEKIKITENELDAQIKKQSDANKYQTEIKAMADLEQRKRIAEAEKYEAEQKASAVKAQAEANKFAKQQEAEGIKAVGEAEASATKAKLLAEAEGLEKKAEAYEKFGQAAIIDMIVKILPEMSKNVAEPLSTIDNVNIYGNGGEVSNISGNVPVVIKQTLDTVKSTTGVDLSEVLKANTIEAKTTHNVNFDTDTKHILMD